MSGGTRRRAPVTLAVIAAAAAACSSPPPAPEPVSPEEHARIVQEWRDWRHDQLVRPDGWLSLTGLYWLETGSSTMGADPGNDLVLTRADAPSRLGSFEVGTDEVVFTPAEDAAVSADGTPFAGGAVWRSQEGAEAVEMSHGTLTWHVIERDGRLGVRLRDADSPLLRAFAGVEYYPLAPEWRLAGTFEAHEPPKIIKVPSILGTIGDEESPGTAVFEVDGTEYRLDLWRDSDDPANFFTAFADETNGDTTYGGGRFLWIDAPDEHGRIVVDFNRSYNPPCAFTPFSTCPLPPMQNRLPLRIEAGELAFETAPAEPAGDPGAAQSPSAR